MNKVLFKSEIRRYSEHLVQILYDHGYFGFKDSAKEYVKELFDDITDNLHTRLHKPAPKHFEKYGKNMKYAAFRKSKNTIWYVFFEIYKEHGEIIYLVRYIANNHVIAQFL
jgi:hypothetical protein